jgi:purine-cytosine permease-like protein
MPQQSSSGMPRGLSTRIVISILVFFAWLIFTIVHLAFFASSFNIYQNIAIILVVVLAGLAILAAMWVSWGMKFAGESKEKHEET